MRKSIFRKQEGTAACRIIEDLLCDVLVPTAALMAYDDEYYYAEHPVPAIKQLNNYYCAPASTLMALIGSGSTYTNDKLTDYEYIY